MSLNIDNLTLDCGDVLAVAHFWSSALSRPIADDASDTFALMPSADGSPAWFFNLVPEGKTVKNRLHIDLAADDRDAEVERLIGLGARRLADHDEGGNRWTTLDDVDDALLAIGMFSRASSLSIKTLRAYHEAGILVPASVDRSTYLSTRCVSCSRPATRRSLVRCWSIIRP